MEELRKLTALLNERFQAYLEKMPTPTPEHRVEFSRRITTSWALIYYRRHLVRLSPYLFLLEPSELKHASHWQELDATLRHEAVHAYLFATKRETGHSQEFHELLARLGVEPNGGCDLGPENAAFRYIYACRACGHQWKRRIALKGRWSCGACAPGRYDPSYPMEILCELGQPWARLSGRLDWISRALDEARASPVGFSPLVKLAPPRPVAPRATTA